jgi:hypothetical protein
LSVSAALPAISLPVETSPLRDNEPGVADVYSYILVSSLARTFGVHRVNVLLRKGDGVPATLARGRRRLARARAPRLRPLRGPGWPWASVARGAATEPKLSRHMTPATVMPTQ